MVDLRWSGYLCRYCVPSSGDDGALKDLPELINTHRIGLQIKFQNFANIALVLMLLNFFLSGIGMDSSITPLRHGGLSLVQTTDFFYPLVDDPYMMVWFVLLVICVCVVESAIQGVCGGVSVTVRLIIVV